MSLNDQQKELLFTAWDYCDEEDKSTEFMFQYMADTAGIDYMDAVDFVVGIGGEERSKWRNPMSHATN